VSLAFTRRIYLCSVWLDLASGARWRALLLRPAVVWRYLGDVTTAVTDIPAVDAPIP